MAELPCPQGPTTSVDVPRAETSLGAFAGVQVGSVSVFRGVRYARAPEGEGRFRPPRPAEPRGGVRSARSFGPASYQQHIAAGLLIPDSAHELNAPESEDCLSLNVTSPDVVGSRPVMVYIHGGNFVEGAGSQSWTDPTALAERGEVVVVTINYRLGALGWLYLDELGGDRYSVESNLGLLDQIAALHWVKDHISAFGGDPGNVTVFGYSAGAWSIAALMAAGIAPGLFQKAIVMSGGVRCHSPDEATGLTRQVLGALEVAPGDLDQLWELPPERFVEALSRVWDKNGHPFPPIRPVADGKLIPTDPLAAIVRGSARGVPVIVGSTLDEFKLIATTDAAEAIVDDASLAAHFESDLGSETARAVIDTYRRARAARGEATNPVDLFWAILSDQMFSVPGVRVAEAQSEIEPASYMYQTRWSAADPRLGACHSVDLALMFGTLDLPGIDVLSGSGRQAERLAADIQAAWGAFAASGDPNHDGLPTWPRYHVSDRNTMIFDRERWIAHAPLVAERDAWRGII